MMSKGRRNSQPSRPTCKSPESAPSRAARPQLPEMAGNGRKNQISAPAPSKNGAGLSPRQQSALPIVAAFPTIAQAARASRTGERTLRRWLEDGLFQEELARHRQEYAHAVRQELQGLMLRSITVISQAMENPDAAIRLRAARYAQSYSIQLFYSEEIESRIETLEDAFSARRTTRPPV